MKNKLKKVKQLLPQQSAIFLTQLAVIVLMLSVPLFIFLTQQSTQSGKLGSTSHAAGSSSTGNTVTCPVTGHQVGPQGFNYDECTNTASWCARQFGLLRSVHVLEHQDCSYTCTDNKSNCLNGTGAGKSCPLGACGQGQICDNNTGQCISGGTYSSASSNGSTGSGGNGGPGGSDTADIPNSQAFCVLPTQANGNLEKCTFHILGGNSPLSTTWQPETPWERHIKIVDPNNGNIQANSDTTVNVNVDCSQDPNTTSVIKIDFLDSGSNVTKTKTVIMSCKSGITVQFAIVGLANPPQHTTRDFSLTLVPSNNLQGNQINISGQAKFDGGNFIAIVPMDNVPPGTYQIKLHIDGTLDTQLTQPNGDNTFTFPKLNPTNLQTVIPGDIGPGQHGDNFIDIIDYNKLIGCIGKQPTGSCAGADLNDDGKIDESDLSLLLGQFGSLGFSFTTPQFSCSIDPNCNSGQNSIQMCSLICTKTN